MKFAVSNIALSPFDCAEEPKNLPGRELIKLEVAPSRVWRDTIRECGFEMPMDDRYKKHSYGASGPVFNHFFMRN